MKSKRPFLIFVFSFFLSAPAFSQYILNGAATKNSCNCYTLTTPVTTQIGSVWNANKISLNSSFDFWFNVFLGCSDRGADGIVFILQPISTSIGTSGEGMGFGGVAPSIGIAVDTYQNFNLSDPSYDHISIQANGIINHTSDLAGPVPASAISNDIEDCQWHNLRISWNAVTKTLTAYFDGVQRVQKQIDLVATIFNNDPNVFWGFTGATGGEVNLQQFCTALDPDFSTNLPASIACAPASVQFSNQSQSFAPIANYSWRFGNGDSSKLQNPAPVLYTQPGVYDVRLKITGLDGCESDTVKTVTVASVPNASLQVFDTCFKNEPRLQFTANNFGVSYQWLLNGNVIATTAQPRLNNLPAGPHNLQLLLASQYNCGLPDTASAAFVIKPLPVVQAITTSNCKLYNFQAQQADNATTINSWRWQFGDAGFSNTQNVVHSYNNYGNFNIQLSAMASNGCASDTNKFSIQITNPSAFAGNDTVVIINQPFQLNAAGNGSFVWTPAIGLSNAFIPNPVGNLSSAQKYLLTVTTLQNCVATDTININAYVGPAVYIPTAFTPNADGLNDVLRPVYVGITKLQTFSVYNRYGQLVFSTSDAGKGWDGTINKQPQGSGSYVWYVSAINYLQQPVTLKGTVTIIK